MKRAGWVTAWLLSAAAALGGESAQELRRLLEGARGAVIDGGEGFLFFRPELAALAAPKFWGLPPNAAAESDPLPAILDFAGQLRGAGIDLLLLPVPAKAAIYPERLPLGRPPELAGRFAPFFAELQRQGVEVLDLEPPLLAAKGRADGPLYCRHDSHWSGEGIAVAARALAARLGKLDWTRSLPRRSWEREELTVEIGGDLWRELPEPRPPRERLRLSAFGERRDGRFEPLAADRESPLLLLGDSHLLVFSAGGDLHARGAGLLERLAAELGFAADRVAVRGSGATPARVNLLRRGDSLRGKRLVVWCFSVREFAAGNGWKKVPVIR